MVRPDELRAWWRAANAAPDGDKFQFTMLTGLRPGEVSGLKVADVDLARGRVDLVDTKNGKPHAVLLSVQAKRIAAERVKDKGPDEGLFTVNDPRLSQTSIIEQSGVPFSPHDLRRTFSSIAGGRLPEYVVTRMMNHSDGGDVTLTSYIQLGDATLRQGWQKVSPTSSCRKWRSGRRGRARRCCRSSARPQRSASSSKHHHLRPPACR